MTSSFSLEGRLGLDASGFKKGATDAGKAIDDVADKIDDLPVEADKAGGKAGGLLSSGLAKGFAAAGGVALIAKAFTDAMNIEAGQKKVEAQFALTAEQAQHYGELGGDLYSNAWGESVQETTTAVAEVGRSLQEVGSIADDELGSVTERALAVAETFDQDVNAVIRSTGQLLRNGLARDADEALDLVARAFTEGGDRAGDLLDTIDEYSQHWARLGIDGSEALGLISEGFNQGFRDGDKLADLFKEFSIRGLEERSIEFFDQLGLVGTTTRDALAEGGEAARDALGDVINGLAKMKDPVERNRIAVELFGTQWEDLGPQAINVLSTIETGLNDVEGAAQDVADTVGDNTAASFEALQRRGTAALAGLADEALPILEGLLKLGEGDASGGVDAAVAAFKDYNIVLQTAKVSTDLVSGAWGFLMNVGRDTADSTDEAAASLSTMGGAMNGFVMEGGQLVRLELPEAIDEVTTAGYGNAEAFDAVKSSTEAMNTALWAAYEAQMALMGSSNSVEEAQWAAEDAVLGLGLTILNGAVPGSREYESALNDAEEASLRVAQAQTDQEIATREAAGETLNAGDKANIFRDKLQGVADKANGPVKAALDGHIATLKAIPTGIDTRVTVDTRAANASLDSLITKLQNINANITSRAAVAANRFRTGEGEPPSGGMATGGAVGAGWMGPVGEAGRETFVAPTAGYILNNRDTALLTAISGAAPHSQSPRSTYGVANGNVGLPPDVRVFIDGRELTGVVVETVNGVNREKAMVN